MEIELSGTVRGERVAVLWHDGALAGSEVLLDRLQPLVDDGRCSPGDLTSVIRCVELVAGQRMQLRITDERGTSRSTSSSAA